MYSLRKIETIDNNSEWEKQPEEQKASTQRYIGCLKMVSGSKMGGSLGGSEMGSTLL